MYEIRADYDRETIVMYQAYDDRIADLALKNQRFVAPFSFNRMTWIKPSSRWLMYRSNWGQKRGQGRTLRVRITRAGWEEGLSLGVLTSPDGAVFGDAAVWEPAFARATVHVQWDTERSPRGAALDHYIIQVGLSRHVIRSFVDEWIVSIEDYSAEVAKICRLLHGGRAKQAERQMPARAEVPDGSRRGASAHSIAMTVSLLLRRQRIAQRASSGTKRAPSKRKRARQSVRRRPFGEVSTMRRRIHGRARS